MADPVTLRVEGEVTSALAAVAKLRDDWLAFAASYGKSAKEVSAALNSFSGDRIIREATTYAKAVEQVGGVSKLTVAEQQRLNAVVTEAIAKYQALGREAPKSLIDLQNATQGAVSKSSSFFDTLFFKITGGVTAGTILANGLLKAFDMITDGIGKLIEGFGYLVERGSKVTNITIGFEQLTAGIGEYAGSVLDKARDKTKGLITDFDLMQAANRAMLFGLDISGDKFGTLGEAAIKLGRAMGMDAAKSMDDLVLALGRVSPRILDNLGIIVKVGEANKMWAEANDRTVKSMTAQERVTAFSELAFKKMNEHLGKMGEIHLTLADKSLILTNRFTNFIDRLSLATAKSGVLNTAMDGLLNAFSNVFSANQDQAIKMIVSSIETLSIWIVKATAFGVDFAMNLRKEWWDLVALGATLTVKILEIADGFLSTSAAVMKMNAFLNPFNQLAQESAKKSAEWATAIKATREEHQKNLEEIIKNKNGQDEWLKGLATTKGILLNLADQMEKNRGKTVEWTEAVVRNKPALEEDNDVTEEAGKKKKTLGDRLNELDEILKKVKPTTENTALVTKEYGGTIEDLTNKATLAGIEVPKSIRSWAQAVKDSKLADTLEEADARISKSMKDEMDKRVKNYYKEEEARTKAFFDAYVKITNAEMDFQEKLSIASKSGIEKRLAEISAEKKKTLEKLGPRPDEIGVLQTQWDAAAESISKFYQKVVDDAVYENRRAIAEARKTWSKDFVAILESVPKLIQEAFTGGGGWRGAATAISSKVTELFGGRVITGALSGVFNKTSNWIADKFGNGVAAALGTAIPGLGAALGSMIGPMLSKIVDMFGNAGRDAVKDFVGRFGGFEGFHRLTDMMGEVGEKMWIKLTQGVGRNNPEEAKAVIAQVEAEIAKLAGSLTTFVDSAAGWGQALPAALSSYLDKLVEAGLLTDEAAAKLKAFGTDAGYDFDKLKELAEKYGVSLDALGPKFRQAEMHKTADEIIRDFEMMLSNGADMNGLLEGMQDEISKVAQHSIKFGTEIPGNMRPWIEELMSSGRLLDENGEKITDINSLHFGDEIQVGLSKIVDKLQEMIDIMTNKVPGSIGNVDRSLVNNIATWREWRKKAQEEADAVRDTVDGISFGSSPGGLKEIPLKLLESIRAMRDFSRDSVIHLNRVRHSVDDIGMIGLNDLALESISRPAPSYSIDPMTLPMGGGLTLNIDTRGAVFSEEETVQKFAKRIGNILAEQYFRQNPIALNAGGR